MAAIHLLNNCLLNNCLFVHFRDPIIDDPFILSVVSLMSEEKDHPYIFVCPTHKLFHSCRGGNVCVFDEHGCCLMTQKWHVCRKYSADRSILYSTEIHQPVKSKVFADTGEDLDEVEKRFNKMVFIDTINQHMEDNGISSGLQNTTLHMNGIFHSMVVQLYIMFRDSMRKDKNRLQTNISHRFDMSAERILIIADSITNHIKTTGVQKERKRKNSQNNKRSITSFQKDVQVLISAYLLHGQILPAEKSCTRWQDRRNTKTLWQKKAPISYWRTKKCQEGGK